MDFGTLNAQSLIIVENDHFSAVFVHGSNNCVQNQAERNWIGRVIFNFLLRTRVRKYFFARQIFIKLSNSPRPGVAADNNIAHVPATENLHLMPTPIGHALAGAIIYKSLPTTQKTTAALLIAVLFFALLPDVDFLFGFPVGDPNRCHHYFTHSLFFVLVAGVAGGIIYAKLRGGRSLIYSAIFASAGISHVILDLLAVDKRAPFGCPVFWPFSNKYFISPVLLFSDVSRVSDSRLFLQSLFNRHNLATVGVELLVLTPILIYILWRKRNHRV